MMTTTYQYDYIAPEVKKFNYANFHDPKDKEKEVCPCIDPPKLDVVVPKKLCPEAEWTGIAPMGRLIEAELIPPTKIPDEEEMQTSLRGGHCTELQPNRFLKILRSVYPDLYERLKMLPKEELARRLEKQRMVTTYQQDYCDMKDYVEDEYESLQEEKNVKPVDAPCDVFRTRIIKELQKVADVNTSPKDEPCEKVYKPFQISFADSSRFSAAGNSSLGSAISFARKANLSEYMDSISRNGCVIMRNKIHDHSRCIVGKHCRHELTDACVRIA